MDDSYDITTGLPQDKIWGAQLRTYFDFTLYFEQAILLLVPSVLFILCFPHYIRTVMRKKPVVRRSLLLWAKLLAGTALMAMQIAISAAWITFPQFRFNLAFGAGAMSSLAAALTILVLYIEHVYSLRPSALISIYLSITILFDIAICRSFLLREMELPGALTAATIVIKMVIILMEEMRKKKIIISEHLRETVGRESLSGFWTIAFVVWINQTLFRGYCHDLTENDLDLLDEAVKSGPLRERFRVEWEKANKESRFALCGAVIRACGYHTMAIGAILQLLLIAFQFSQPFIIGAIVSALMQNEMEASTKGGLIGAVAIAYFGAALSHVLFGRTMIRYSAMTRACVGSAVYDKMLRLPFSVLDKSSVLTLMSTDVATAATYMNLFLEFVSALVAIVVALVYLGIFVGAAAVLALIPMSITAVLTIFSAKKMRAAQIKWNEAAEARIGIVRDMLQSMKSVRMGGLTGVFSACARALIENEIAASREGRAFHSVLFGLEMFSTAVAPVLLLAGGLFWTHRATGMSSSDIYSLISVTVLVVEPLTRAVHSIGGLARRFACITRIQKFLLRDELIDTRQKLSTTIADAEKSTSNVAQIINVSSVPDEEGRRLFKNVSAEFPAGQTSMIIGPVGSGKSSVLDMIIGEFPIESGQIVTDVENIALCGQSPWIQNGTVKENIVGAYPVSDSRYNTVIRACCLDTDVARWPQGHNTQVGNDGCNLSGGQKQRVALARALCSKKPVLVLDDIFSGLDKTTSKSITESLLGDRSILKEANTTIIMSTNLIGNLHYADQVLELKDGAIVKVETQKAIKEATFMKDAKSDDVAEAVDESAAGSIDEHKEKGAAQAPETAKANTVNRTNLRSDYKHYVKAFGLGPILTIIAWTAISEFLMKSPNVYLRIWLDINPADLRYFAGFAILGLFGITSSTSSVWYFFVKMVAVSYGNLHETILKTTLGATFYYLSNTESGSLLNRFSQDMERVSQDLPFIMLYTIELFFMAFIDFIIIASGASYAGLVVPVLFVFLVFVQRFYMATSRQLRNLQLEATAPLMTHLNETASGIRHIRTFRTMGKFTDAMLNRLDSSLRPHYQMECTQLWLLCVLEMSVTVMAIIVIAVGIVINKPGSANGLGLSMVNMISLGMGISATFNMWSKMETALTSVGRIKTFEEDTPQEPVVETEVAADWPAQGRIEFHDVSAKYDPNGDESTVVLHNVNLTIEAGKKVGIVGRTGSGKTALMMSLAKMVSCTGAITIDGINLNLVNNELLRARITAIPQDSIEIPGTLRFNICPFEYGAKVEDSLMISILTRTGIWEYLSERGGLDAEIKSLKLSPGQRQMVCITRGVVHHLHTQSKVVLMDEISSQLDYETDKTVQEVLEAEFKDCTVLTIAHRTETLSNVDMLIEMADGIATTSTPSKVAVTGEPSSSATASE